MKKFSRIVSAALAMLVIAGSAYGITHRQQIMDDLALRNYVPSERIIKLADETSMQDATRRVFYVNHPELNNKSDFKNKCPATEQSIVLGCYVQHTGIYLLDVDDERLSGVIQVTAAHETLHAEYDRLSSSERTRVDGMTAAFFANIQDERIKSTIELYRKKDPSVVPNELHSILATEVRDLSPELESYYSQYFKNRAQVVTLSEKYEQTFVNLTSQVTNYDSQLLSLKGTIDSNQVEIQGQNTEIERQKARLDSLVINRTDEYNAAVPAYNAQINSYNALINKTRSLIAEYNDIVEKRNAIATTEQQLVEAIDSNSVRQTQ